MIARLSLLLVAVLYGLPPLAAANEARCDELGANCICNEPYNTDTWANVSTWWYDPADTTGADKECNNEGVAGTAYSGDGFGLTIDTVGSNPTMFAALPSGANITFIPRSAEGAGNGSFATRFRSGVDPTARQGIRFYRYYSPNFQFTDVTAPLCNSNKVAQLGYNGNYTGGPMYQGVNSWALYDFSTSTGWSASVDCCGGGDMPGQSGTLPTMAGVKGHWIRHEVYLNNNTTSGTTTTEWYVKDVTAGTAEATIVNTAGDARFTGVHSSTPQYDFAINSFRANNGDACPGYFAHTHFLAAAWSSNAGQRIGAATEIEGGGGGGGVGGDNPTGTKRMSPMINLRRGS